jgi:hypothetical protein
MTFVLDIVLDEGKAHLVEKERKNENMDTVEMYSIIRSGMF